jgi:hypothetical protein
MNTENAEGLCDDTRAAVLKEVERGIVSPEIIAIKLGLSIETVEEILKECRAERLTTMSNADILKANLRVLQDLLDTAELMYRSAPTIDNVTSVTSLISTSISTIKEIESRKDPAIVLNEILAKVLQPMFRDFIKYVTVETSRARDDLYQCIPREHHPHVDRVVKDLVKGVGRSGGEDYKRCVAFLTSILGCKPEDEKVKPLLRPVSGAADEQQEKEGTSGSTDSSCRREA